MKRQYSLSITFYKDSYDFPISGGDTISKYYKPTIKKVVNALKSYHNKKDLHIIPNETFFGIKDIYAGPSNDLDHEPGFHFLCIFILCFVINHRNLSKCCCFKTYYTISIIDS